jgi:hypothetical protein
MLALARPALGTSPVLLVLAAGGTALVYAAIFIVGALGRKDRQWYLEKVHRVSRRALPQTT